MMLRREEELDRVMLEERAGMLGLADLLLEVERDDRD